MILLEPGSFRDPGGQILYKDGRVLRALTPGAQAAYRQVESSGLFADFIARGWLVPTREVPEDLGASDARLAGRAVLEHDRLAFISYPYEWCFSQLRAAALLHLDIQIEALSRYGVVLSDATAFNVQFVGGRPVFIDLGAFRLYREGEYWLAHNQFVESFLNPLLLAAHTGVAHNSFYRGALDGIATSDTARLLPARAYLSPAVWTHVLFPARAQGRRQSHIAATAPSRPFPKSAYLFLLRNLRGLVEGLAPSKAVSLWQAYEQGNSYAAGDEAAKRELVTRYCQAVKPGLLMDLGCNAGVYSLLGLTAGAGYVVGLDGDLGALEHAYSRAKENRDFLPLYNDLANPSPRQGWNLAERGGIIGRSAADGVLALALAHHLMIGRNVPMAGFVQWMVSVAPSGIVEFVSKDDPMVQRLLSLREDVFEDYGEARFMAALSEHCRIVEVVTTHEDRRKLIWFNRSN